MVFLDVFLIMLAAALGLLALTPAVMAFGYALFYGIGRGWQKGRYEDRRD